MRGCWEWVVWASYRARAAVSERVRRVVESQVFEYLTLAVIVANSVFMAGSQASPSQLQAAGDLFFDAYYGAELVLKVLALGFVFNKGAYLRNSWNVFDFVIVTSSIVSRLFSTTNTYFSLKPLRVFRVLRPLRTIVCIK